MRILLSPIGKSDPHGKPDQKTGEDTAGSALAICAAVRPDVAILLPTECADGEDTRRNAEETREWMQAERSEIEVLIHPVTMQEPQNYEEALRAYGTAVVAEAQAYPNADCYLNASSGTPAIKFACLLVVAEGRLAATPYYADDPTRSRRADPVYPLNVTFLRESALIQRVGGLLAQGQFGLALGPLEELVRQAFRRERQHWAERWQTLCDVLRLWDERNYRESAGRIGKLLREWAEAPPAVRDALSRQQAALQGLTTTPSNGLRAWDVYFYAARLEMQGHLIAAFVHLWTAIEIMTFERLEREHGIPTGDYELRQAIYELEARLQDQTFLFLWQSKLDKTSTIQQAFHSLRRIRNAALHEGEPVTAGELNRMMDFTRSWISSLGGAIPTNYPLSPEDLRSLSALFTANDSVSSSHREGLPSSAG